MTIKELKEELENYDEDLVIRIAEQPNYPFAYSIQGLKEKEEESGEIIVYILEGLQKNNLPKELFE